MGEVLIDIIDDVIISLEDGNYDAYAYDNQKFHMIDKENNIDFQARLGFNNYYFKNNISGITFMKVKKYIDDNTTIQQILIEEYDEKCYFSFLERDGNIKLVSAIRAEGDSSLVCKNMNVINQDWDAIKEYANDVFDIYTNLDEIEAREVAEEDIGEDDQEENEENVQKMYNDVFYDDQDDEPEEDYNAEYPEDEDGLEESNESPEKRYRYEFNQIEESRRYGLSDQFEKNTIDAYEEYVSSKAQNRDDDEIPQEDLEFVEEVYRNYEVLVNKRKVDGTAKYRIVSDCEVAIDMKSFDCVMYDNAVVRLKGVIEAVQKREESYIEDEKEK